MNSQALQIIIHLFFKRIPYKETRRPSRITVQSLTRHVKRTTRNQTP